MAIKVGSLLIDIGANVARVQKDMGKISHVLNRRAAAWKRTVSAVKVAIAGMFTGVVLQRMVSWVDQSIDFAESLEKMSQKVGIATETLSGYSYAAEISGTSIDNLKTGIIRLSRNIEDAKHGIGTGKRVLDQMGLSAEKLKNLKLEDVIARIANRFHGMADGAQKTAEAQLLAGRSGAELIPFFNNGAKGIERLIKVNRELGGEISTNTAKAAAEFKDRLTDMETISKGLGVTIATELLPGLTFMTERFIAGTKEGGLLLGIWRSLKALGTSINVGGDNVNILKTLQGQYTLRVELVDTLEKQIAGKRKLLQEAQDRHAAMKAANLSGDIGELGRRRRQALKEMASLDEQIEAATRRRVTEAKAGEKETDRTNKAADAASGRLKKRQAAVIAKLEHELALHGEISNVERARYDIEKGAFKDFSGASKARILALSEEKDARVVLAQTAVEQYNRTKKAAEEAAKRESELRKKFTDDAKRAAAEWKRAEDERLQHQQERLRESQSQIESWASQASQSFVDFNRTGRLEFSSLVDSILADLIRLRAQRGLLEPLIGALFGGRGGNAGAAAPSGGGGDLSGSGHGEIPFPSIPRPTMGISPISVQVNNNAPMAQASASVTEGSGGRQEIQVMVESIVDGGVGGGRYDGSLGRRYGLTARGGGR